MGIIATSTVNDGIAWTITAAATTTIAVTGVAAVTSALTMLELRGLVRQERPLVYARP